MRTAKCFITVQVCAHNSKFKLFESTIKCFNILEQLSAVDIKIYFTKSTCNNKSVSTFLKNN